VDILAWLRWILRTISPQCPDDCGSPPRRLRRVTPALNVVHPFREIGQTGWNRVVELVAISSPLHCSVTYRCATHGFVSKTRLTCWRESTRFPITVIDAVSSKRDRFLILLEAIGPKKEEMYLRFVIPRFSVFYLSSCCI
jgi:hypothetical protein